MHVAQEIELSRLELITNSKPVHHSILKAALGRPFLGIDYVKYAAKVDLASTDGIVLACWPRSAPWP